MNQDEYLKTYTEWVEGMTPAERSQAAELGVVAPDLPGRSYAMEPNQNAAVVNPEPDPEPAPLTIAPTDTGIIAALLTLLESDDAKADMLAVLYVFKHPAIDDYVHAKRTLGITGNLRRLASRFVKRCEVRLHYSVCDVFAWLVCRPRPAMSVVCLLRAINHPEGSGKFSEIGATFGVSKQNVAMETRKAAIRFRQHRSQYRKHSSRCKIYAMSNFKIAK